MFDEETGTILTKGAIVGLHIACPVNFKRVFDQVPETQISNRFDSDLFKIIYCMACIIVTCVYSKEFL